MLEQVLQVEGLTKTYGKRNVVNDISFDVKRGEMFGYLGPNGSGKTTTIRMALDIIRPNDGSVRILGSLPERPGAGCNPLPWPPQGTDFH